MARHERLELLDVDSGGVDWTGGAGFAFTVTRQADDLPIVAKGGKGEVDCGERAIFVLSY